VHESVAEHRDVVGCPVVDCRAQEAKRLRKALMPTQEQCQVDVRREFGGPVAELVMLHMRRVVMADKLRLQRPKVPDELLGSTSQLLTARFRGHRCISRVRERRRC
jgi:hypothetical protein